MELYVGTKTLFAKEMNKEDYCKYRDWIVPENEDPKEEGYLVEYTDGGKSNHPLHKGYVSWSPKEVFEKTYLKINKDLLNINKEEFISFKELVEYSKTVSQEPHWHFKYKECTVTHVNNDSYYFAIGKFNFMFKKGYLLKVNDFIIELRQELTNETIFTYYRL